jgi:hypothetical protein
VFAIVALAVVLALPPAAVVYVVVVVAALATVVVFGGPSALVLCTRDCTKKSCMPKSSPQLRIE